MVHHDVCPVCSSERISLHFRCVDHFISKETFGIYKCDECSFEFTQDHPGEGAIGQYYDSDEYVSHTDSAAGFINKVYRFVRRIMLKNKKGIIRKVTGLKTGSLLDIGSGTGHFASEMKESGWQVKGIEMNEKARNYSILKFGLNILAPDQIRDIDENSLDCVTLWHVLEHLNDPYKYADIIYRLLKPGGSCIVALPNHDSYDAGHYGHFWAAWDVPRHLWHFNPQSFSKFCENAGFVPEGSRRLTPDLFYISILSEKYRESGCAELRGLIKALFFFLFSSFNRRRSSSLIYFLKKPGNQ
jgi:SAM-dependent methyltransferase